MSLYLTRKSKLAGHDGVTLILLLNFEPGLADTTARVCIVDVKNNERTQGFALLYMVSAASDAENRAHFSYFTKYTIYPKRTKAW